MNCFLLLCHNHGLNKCPNRKQSGVRPVAPKNLGVGSGVRGRVVNDMSLCFGGGIFVNFCSFFFDFPLVLIIFHVSKSVFFCYFLSVMTFSHFSKGKFFWNQKKYDWSLQKIWGGDWEGGFSLFHHFPLG